MTEKERRYINFWTRIFNYKGRIKNLPVDFTKPWWQIIFDQKYTFGLLLIF